MVENWVKIESFFREQGILFELKSWCYLCLIEGRHFYYSPQTGKWRMKGKRAWHTSQSPEDFMAQAKAYSPPDYQSNQQKTQQKKSTKQKKKKQQKQTRQKTYYSYQSYSDHQSSSSDQHQQSTEEIKGIRSEFLDIFEKYLQEQRENDYKIGWIWYKLKEEILPDPLEICWLSVVFKYSPYWAVYKTEELYGTADRTTLLLLIKLHRQEWLARFEKRWGIKEEHQQRQQYRHNRQRQQRQQRQQRTKSSRQHHTTSQSFVHHAYLQILGLTFPFTLQDLKRAYRKKALETHPDSGGTAEAFRSVHNAYQALLASC